MHADRVIFTETGRRGVTAVRSAWVSVSNQPAWVVRAALVAAFIVLTGVVLLLVIPALLAGLFVYALTAAAARVRALFPGGRTRSLAHYRRNVRVVGPADERPI